MRFLVGTITRCAGQNHYTIPLTINGSIAHTLVITTEELQKDYTEISQVREDIIDRIRSEGKELGASTFQQWRTALEGKEMHI